MNKDELYQVLLQKGVSRSHIENMKQAVNISEDPYKRYYDDEEEKIFENVPVSKIKGLGFRGTLGLSWFDHACCNGTHNISMSRCQTAFDYLKTQPLQEFHSFYERHPVQLKHYVDDDFYVVYGNGTHRTLWAKITNAPFVRAQVDRVRKNHTTFKCYQLFKQLEADFNEYLSSKNLCFKRFQKDYNNLLNSTTDIGYKGEIICFYPILSPEVFFNKRTLNTETLQLWQEQQERFKQEYSRINAYKISFIFSLKWCLISGENE